MGIESLCELSSCWAASSTISLTVFRKGEVLGVRGTGWVWNDVGIVNWNLRDSSGDSVFVEIVVFLIAIEFPLFVRPIFVNLVHSVKPCICFLKEVPPDHSTPLAAIAAEAANFPFGEVQISFAWIDKTVPPVTMCLQEVSWPLKIEPQ